MSKIFGKLSSNMHDHAKWWIGIILAITVVLAFGLPNLEIKMGNDVFVSNNSAISKDSNKYMRHFGGDSYYVMQSGKQSDILSHKNMQELYKFDKKIKQIDNVRGTTDLVTVLNQELANAGKGDSDSLSGQINMTNSKLQKDLMNSLSDKQKTKVQNQIQNSLTEQQKQQVQNYAASQLSNDQQKQLQNKIQSSLSDQQQKQVQNYVVQNVLNDEQKQQLAQAQQIGSADPEQMQQMLQKTLNQQQQAQVQKYTQSILTSQQQGMMQGALNGQQQENLQKYTMGLLNDQQKQAMVQTVVPMLPKVQNMSTALLRDIFLSDDGKVPNQMKQMLPKNGKMNLVLINTSEKAANMDTDVQLNHDINKVIKNADFGHDVKVKLAGQPGIIGQIRTEVLSSMVTMFAIAIVIMIVVLALIFPVRRRLLALLFVVPSLIWTFGIMGWLNLPITLATMATLPIIIGLGTDFGVQFHNRYEEEFRKRKNAKEAAKQAVEKMGPAVGVALVVMTFSFLTLFLSKAPLMQQFGLTLAIGVISSYLVEFSLMFGSLTLLDSDKRKKNQNKKEQQVKFKQPSMLSKLLARYANFVTRNAGIVMLIGVILGVFGFSVEKNIDIETDITKFIPQDMQALKNTKSLQNNIGSTTYITYLVDAGDSDVSSQENMQTLSSLGKKVDNKYSDITDVQSISTQYETAGGKLDAKQADINKQIKLLPSALTSTIISKDYHYATMQFKVKKGVSSAKQLTLMNKMTKTLKKSNGNLKISPAGAQSMMLVAIDNISANHTLIELVGLAVIFLILFLIYRNWRVALYPVVPILIVLGLSPLTLWAIGTPYNPLTITLSALVLGIGTEFTILILERYREEFEKSHDTRKSIVQAVSSVGSAITVSGLTVVGGFTAIMFSSFPVLRQFGLITVLDTAYALISALTILPAFIYLLRNRKKEKQNKDTDSADE
ncbi:hydrophobe/amphiphile efflux-3 (HAE3) family transporter [Ligilactobacillus acidipiscis]|uniref:hydrophobe/amphiphile efflux-3 (HAE3) family transporter n=1 Tax=Ligilactobacillus acidipiscis TaxID=89059 RepID=UPI0022E3E340|nr:hydrophobe/amphiphile efflux-3 (HAE3) family transporter [Ligilactobacillus acidipiscis]